MRKTSVPVLLSLLLVFASGIVVGAFGHQFYEVRTVSATPKPGRRPTPEELRKQYVGKMQTRLKLKPEQLPELNAILDISRAGYRSIREKFKPEMQQIRDDQETKIKAVLEPTQQVEYQRMIDEEARERKEMEAQKPGK